MSDEHLRRRVADALALELHLDASRVDVSAREGIVILAGVVSSFAEELAAVRVVRAIEGVAGIDDRLQIDLAPSVRSKLHSYVRRHGYVTQ